MTDISLDNLLANLYRSDQNFIQFMDSLQKAYTGNDESLEFTWVNSDGSETVKNIPSLASLMLRLRNIERTTQESFNYSTRDISVKMSSGETRRFIVSDPMQNPTLFKFPNTISNFTIKENLIKDKLLDPYTSIEVPIDLSLYPLFSKFYYLKVVINNDDSSVSTFDQLFKNKLVSYIDCLKALEDNSVLYDRKTGISEFMPKNLKNVGAFSVLSINRDNTSTDVTNNVTYTLSSIRYKNAENRDIVLKVGDKLINNKTSVYEVTRVLDDERKISVKVVEGFDPILRGVNNLVLYSEKTNNSVEIPVGSEERFVLFLKPINPTNQLVNNDWGTGTGIYLYELKDNNNNTFFDGLTTDLWDKLKAISESNITSSARIVTPRTPTLSNEYFSIQLLNSHKKEYSNVERFRKLIASKQQNGYKITALNLSLDAIRESLSNVNLTSNEEKNLKDEEKKIIAEQDIISQSLKNTSNEIMELASVTSEFKPKYGIVGIVPFPEPVYTDPANSKGKQDIIGYEMEYRYVSKDSKMQEFESKNISDNNQALKFIPSKWIKYETSIRKMGKNGRYVDETLSDPDVVKPNQYQISVSSNETVEMRIRSISESGYPIKQVFSDWSEIISVEFPKELEEGINNILELAKAERGNNDFSDELSRQKLIGHASDGFDNKDISFKHHANNIATNNKTPEQGNLSVQAVLDNHSLSIEQIKQILSSQDGQIRVRVLGADDIELAIVKNNTVVKIDGGLYSEHVRNLTVKKGQIINQTYYVEVENVGDGALELVSYVTGKSTNPLTDGYDGYIFNKGEYNDYRKYNKVPMVVADIATSAFNDFTMGRYFQNKQTQGQSAYSRFRDMTLNHDLYIEDSVGINGLNLGTPIQTSQSFIWNGSLTATGNTPSGDGKATDFCVHIDHPSVKAGSFVMNNFTLFALSGFMPTKNFDATLGGYILPPFSHSKYSARNTNEADFSKQLYCKDFIKKDVDVEISDQIFKNFFLPDDQFLIGKKTCGLYLGLGTINRDAIEVENNSYNSGETLLKGEKKIIPIYASSRLTDYYGADNSGIGNIGGTFGTSNVRFEKTIGIDILYKSKNDNRLFSFDFAHGIQYQNGNI